jgi:hypothetical protein
VTLAALARVLVLVEWKPVQAQASGLPEQQVPLA